MAARGEQLEPRELASASASAPVGEHPPNAGGAPDAPDEPIWIAPPFQPLRALAVLALTAAGFGLYEYVLLGFWSSPWLGIHDRTPWPAYAGIAAGLILALAAIRVALGIWSPHARLALGLLAFFACAVVGIGGGRFVSYTLRGTLNPPFALEIRTGDAFPPFALADQGGTVHRGPGAPGDSANRATLIYVYRGDFCPFARHELAELTALRPALGRDGVNVIAISADPVARSRMLAYFLRTRIPLLSDARESILRPLGLVQRHRDGEPDSAIPAFFILDRAGVVRWLFTSTYYRELPRPAELLAAARSVVNSEPR
jgi:peroxiredoxin